MAGPDKERRVAAEGLETFTKQVFLGLGSSAKNAEIVSRHLVEANLRGVDSHGVSRIPVYSEGIAAGDINPTAEPVILKETGTTALVDAKRSFGQVGALFSVEVASAKAKENGLAAVGARNLNHIGMLSYYGAILAERGFIGKVFTNGLSRVAPYGGKSRLFGTNPLCIAFPVKGRDPIVVDISTAMAAAFKVVLAAKSGKSIPKDWAVGPDGSPTTDPKAALEGALLPFGGHKGYGLGVAVEILSSAMTGSPPSAGIKAIPYSQGGLYIEATGIGIFRDEEEYYREVAELAEMIRRSPRAQGFEEVLLPGDPEIREKKRRQLSGIPISESLWTDLLKLAGELSLQMPSVIGGD